ncbi:MAG: TolC family protein [Myxococcales bacterium]
MRQEKCLAAACLAGWLLGGGVCSAQDAKSESVPSFDLMGAIAQGEPLRAEEAVTRVTENSPALERAEALVRASEAAVERARTQLLPRLELTARYTHIDGFPNSRIGALDPAAADAARTLAQQINDPAARALWLSSIDRQAQGQAIVIPRNQTAFAARVLYPVSDLFFAVVPSIQAARASARATEAQARAKLNRVRLSAREAYYQLARARGNLAVAQRAVEQARVQHARIEAGVKAGLRPAADAASSGARLALAEQTVVSMESAVDVADAALRTLLLDPDGAPYGIGDPILDDLDASEVASAALLLGKARAQRAEISALTELIESQRHNAKANRANGYPHVSVFAGGDYANPNRYQIPPKSEYQPSWEVGALVSYAPNDSWSAAKRVRENEAQIDALEAELAELEQALTLEVRNARAVLVRANRSAQAARTAEAAAQTAYERRMAELHVGDVTTADLFAAENELNAARLQVLDSAVERHLARARLAYALGE